MVVVVENPPLAVGGCGVVTETVFDDSEHPVDIQTSILYRYVVPGEIAVTGRGEAIPDWDARREALDALTNSVK